MVKLLGMRSGAILLLYFIVNSICAQEIPTKKELVNHYGFEQSELVKNKERIVFYTYQKNTTRKTKLVMYLQGSDPSPLFSYRIDKKGTGKLCFLKGEFRELSDEYLYVAVEKVGFEGLIDENNIPKPKIYQEKNSLHDRVFRANEVINHLDSVHRFSKIIVFGHSEGAPVAAKLATQNDKITHLGFWAGNVLPDFFDFVLEVRKAYYKGELSTEKAQKQIDEILDGFVKRIARDTANVNMAGYTNKRWWSYAEPPLNNLLRLEIPIYVQVATEDESAPIESTYLLPLEFARLGKTNLTYEVCVGCDHSFKFSEKGKRKWNEIFSSFIAWTESNNKN